MPKRQSETDVFDRWVRSTLADQYAKALSEPLPDAMLKLLQDDAD